MKEKIRIRYEDRCVHIQNDEALFRYLQRHPDAEYYLAEHILKTYRKRYGRTLRISRNSLATEIRWHVRVYRWMKIMKIPGKILEVDLIFQK